MGESDLTSPLLVFAVAGFFLACIALAAVVLVWGMAQWANKGEHRLGERWDGARVEVVDWTGTEGYVRADGELWRATSADALEPGETVRVARMDGLVLQVRRKEPS